jgi:hypothetical protein
MPQRDVVEVYLTGQQQAFDLSRRAQEHEDTTLTWALALMSGALLALPSTLQALDLHVEWTRRGYLLACAPWVLGSVTAVFGRFFYRLLRTAEDEFYFRRTVYLNRALLERDPTADVERFDDVVAISIFIICRAFTR